MIAMVSLILKIFTNVESEGFHVFQLLINFDFSLLTINSLTELLRWSQQKWSLKNVLIQINHSLWEHTIVLLSYFYFSISSILVIISIMSFGFWIFIFNSFFSVSM